MYDRVRVSNHVISHPTVLSRIYVKYMIPTSHRKSLLCLCVFFSKPSVYHRLRSIS
ncbi:unnamed protein product [Periconia digitata]|uniref:Uncharacterized protein n=1 Tax=Periconia digitata TaxID=1303443 RepID=A0A9W4U675_9PLEO|nr:unnamed protein product [Periconia digitata]